MGGPGGVITPTPTTCPASTQHEQILMLLWSAVDRATLLVTTKSVFPPKTFEGT